MTERAPEHQTGDRRVTRIALAIGAVAAAVLAGALLVVLLGGNEPDAGASPSPSASATPVAQPTDTPSPTPAMSPSGSPSAMSRPSATPLAEDPEVGELALSFEPWSDIVSPYRTSLMEDGRLVTIRIGAGPEALTQRRLTPEGIELLRQEILDTGLFTESGFYGPVARPGEELPGRGASGYVVEIGTDAGIVEVRWVSVEADEVDWAEPSPERERLDVLGERLETLESWLPAEAWAEEEPVPYVPLRYRLFTIAQAWGGEPADLPPDVSEVEWPLDATVLTHGEETEGSNPDYVVRCGVVSVEEAEQVRAALSAAGAPMNELGSGSVIPGQLGERATTRVVEVLLVALHPHEDSCDDAAPPSFY